MACFGLISDFPFSPLSLVNQIKRPAKQQITHNKQIVGHARQTSHAPTRYSPQGAVQTSHPTPKNPNTTNTRTPSDREQNVQVPSGTTPPCPGTLGHVPSGQRGHSRHTSTPCCVQPLNAPSWNAFEAAHKSMNRAGANTADGEKHWVAVEQVETAPCFLPASKCFS